MFLMTLAKMILIIIIESVSRKALQKRMVARQNGAQTSTSHFVEIKSSGRFGTRAFQALQLLSLVTINHYLRMPIGQKNCRTLLVEMNTVIC